MVVDAQLIIFIFPAIFQVSFWLSYPKGAVRREMEIPKKFGKQNFLRKLPPILVTLGVLEKYPSWSKHFCDYLLVNCVKNWATLYSNIWSHSNRAARER